MNQDFLDVVLVTSLGLLALSSLIFLIFFIPVLVQLTKTLKALRGLLNTVLDFSSGINSNLSKMSDKIGQFGKNLFSFFVGIRAGISELLAPQFHRKK